jgi:hypothetical protein
MFKVKISTPNAEHEEWAVDWPELIRFFGRRSHYTVTIKHPLGNAKIEAVWVGESKDPE